MIETFRQLLYQFGGKKDVITIFIFFIVFYFFNSIIQNKVLRIITSLATASFVILQLVSLYFTQSFIGYQFFIHLDLYDISSFAFLYMFPIVFTLLFFVLLSVFYFFSPVLLNNLILKNLNNNLVFMIKILHIVVVIGLFCLIFKKSDFPSDTYSLSSLLLPVTDENSESKFEDILIKYKMVDYVVPEEIKCSGGKNIIVISLESFERSFLSGKFASLTPNLQKLRKEWNYTDIKQNYGSGWTSGSLYTSLTGFPAYFGVQGNTIFQKAYESKISSISHVLKKANYHLTFMNGDANFSGTKEMLHALKFDKIIDKYNVKYPDHFRIRDKDLFSLAKIEIKDRLSRNNPFALFISTTDTHFPDGIYDERMEDFISKKNSNLEFMVAAVDYMIGDFIHFLDKENLLSNSSIFIYPDHLKMGDPSMFESNEERGLYLITNTKISEDSITKKYQLDIPKIILKGAEVEHNLKFYTDYVSGDKNKYIINNIAEITEINTHGLLRQGEAPIELNVSEDYVIYKQDTTRYIAHAGGQISQHTYTNSKEALDLNYKKGFRLFELDIIKTKEGKYVAAHDWKHWSSITNYKGTVPVTIQDFLQHKIHDIYTPLDMVGINNWFSEHKDAILITDKINEPIAFSEKFIDPSRLMMKLFDLESVKKGLATKIKSAMPSHNVVVDYTKEDVAMLYEIGVKHVAVSRTFIENHKDILLAFKGYGIKVYAYGVNFIDGINEEYVSKYEMDFIHGIYADQWDF